MPTPQESAHRTPAAADNDLIDGEKDDDGVDGMDDGEDVHGHVGRGDGGFGADHVGLRGRGDTRRACAMDLVPSRSKSGIRASSCKFIAKLGKFAKPR